MHLLAQSTTTSPDYNQAAGVAALLGSGVALIFVLIFFVILIGVYYLILKKTGYNPWLSLLILIPGLGGLILLILLAFTEWPIQREVRELRARAGGGGGYPPAGGGYPPPAGGYTPPPYPPGPSIPPGGPITPA